MPIVPTIAPAVAATPRAKVGVERRLQGAAFATSPCLVVLLSGTGTRLHMREPITVRSVDDLGSFVSAQRGDSLLPHLQHLGFQSRPVQDLTHNPRWVIVMREQSSGGHVIEVKNLTKRYGKVTAVDDVSFSVNPGVVTGFLGPNGAGKSTTMRMILGLDRPDAGTVLVNGQSYRSARTPVAEIGALLEAKGFDKARSARNHLRVLAATSGIPDTRVDEVLTLVGLSAVGPSKAGGYSLGMGQRLGIAVALLGDPRMVMLDEPVNGLDPDGVLWIRNLLRQLADEGRTVFLSSHLMTEMELIADQLIIIGRGRILADTSMREFIANSSANRVRVVSPSAVDLKDRLQGRATGLELLEPNVLLVSGLGSAEIGQDAFSAGFVLHELTPLSASLEEAFMELTKDSVQFQTDGAAA